MKKVTTYNAIHWNEIPRNMLSSSGNTATPSSDDIQPTRKAEPVSAPKRKWWQFWL